MSHQKFCGKWIAPTNINLRTLLICMSQFYAARRVRPATLRPRNFDRWHSIRRHFVPWTLHPATFLTADTSFISSRSSELYGIHISRIEQKSRKKIFYTKLNSLTSLASHSMMYPRRGGGRRRLCASRPPWGLFEKCYLVGNGDFTIKHILNFETALQLLRTNISSEK